MEKRKPNILVTIALVLLVLAAIVCVVVFLSSLGGGKTPSIDNTTPSDAQLSTEPSESDALSPEPGAVTEAETPTEPSQPLFDAAALQAELDDCLDGLTSSWQVSVIDVASGTVVNSVVNCKEEELMVAADLPELFIMAAVYDQLQSGKLTEDQVSGLLTEMIREDKDSASNELTKLLGGGDGAQGRKAVNEFAKAIGCNNVEFNRLFGEQGTQNYVTAGDCAKLLQMIARGECVSQEASAKMQELMTGAPGERIPGGAPTGASVAHLNANITGTCCADAGIVSTDSGEIVIAIVCNNPFTNEGSTKKCVEITQLVSKYLG